MYRKLRIAAILPCFNEEKFISSGKIDSLIDETDYVRVIQKRTGLKIGCPEEIAYKEGFIDKTQLLAIAEPLIKSGYGKYLTHIGPKN
jgi:glucose-1-phosphate thymidylyltransferase